LLGVVLAIVVQAACGLIHAERRTHVHENGRAWWLNTDVDEEQSEINERRYKSLMPVAFLHVPKCGESMFNLMVHIPGACPRVPEDFAVTAQSVHNPLPIQGFYEMFGWPPPCPGAFNMRYMGGHAGIGSERTFRNNFIGHGITMLASQSSASYQHGMTQHTRGLTHITHPRPHWSSHRAYRGAQ